MWCFNELSLDKPLEMIAFHLEFILKFILCLFMNNKTTALYSVPSIEDFLFSWLALHLCYFFS